MKMSERITRTTLIEMIRELKNGIMKLCEIIFDTIRQFQENLTLLQSTPDETNLINLRENLSKLKVNDMSLRSLGDTLEGLSVKILSLQAPVSRDLRRVISSFRMIYDLERISRDTYNAYMKIISISPQNKESYKKQIKLVLDTISYGEKLLNQFIQIYELSSDDNYDIGKIMKEAINLDTEIDKIFENSSVQIIQLTNNNEIVPETGYYFLSSFRSLERMGDHCCNLIERAMYIQTGEKMIIK